MTQPSTKLFEQVRQTMRLKHYAYSTEKSYLTWIRRFILFHELRHPRAMGKDQIESFLSHLAVKEKVAASTQNQALSAFIVSEPIGQNRVKKLDPSPPLKETPRESPLPRVERGKINRSWSDSQVSRDAP